MITCSINNPKIVSLLYSHILFELKETPKGKTFNHDVYLKNLYKKFAEATSPEVAAKYLQSVPRLIIHAAITYFEETDVDFKTLKDLSKSFKSDNAINTIIDTLSDKKINLKDIIDRIKSNEIEEEEEEEDLKALKKPKRLLTTSPLSGTIQTLLPKNPESNLIIEETDPNKLHIINTLENLSASQDMQDDLFNFVYQGKILTIKP